MAGLLSSFEEPSLCEAGQLVPPVFSRFLGWNFEIWSLNVVLGHFSATFLAGNLISRSEQQPVFRIPGREGPQLQPVPPLHHLADPASLAEVMWKVMPAAQPPQRQGRRLCLRKLHWAGLLGPCLHGGVMVAS